MRDQAVRVGDFVLAADGVDLPRGVCAVLDGAVLGEEEGHRQRWDPPHQRRRREEDGREPQQVFVAEICTTFGGCTSLSQGLLWLGVQGYAERTGGGQDGDEDTSKMSLRQLKLLLAARHGMAAALAAFDDMELVIIRSLLAVQKIMINDKHCFVRTLTPTLTPSAQCSFLCFAFCVWSE